MRAPVRVAASCSDSERAVIARAIAKAIEHGNYFRRPALGVRGRDTSHKEWLHFACCTDELDLLVNFSVVSHPRQEVPRLVCAVRGDGWDGDVDSYPTSALTVHGLSNAIRIGENYAEYDGECFHVYAECRRRPIRVALTLRPVAVPSLGNNIEFAEAERIHWFMVPHLEATGMVQVGARTYYLRRAPSYHDHNWGRFRWGRDACWLWGYGQGTSGESSWALIFSRMMNLARSQDYTRGLAIWCNGRQQRIFEDADITIIEHGRFRASRVFKLPRMADLYHPGEVVEVPARLELSARRREDFVSLTFQPLDICQIIVPNDSDLGSTVINEVSGTLEVVGSIRGQEFRFTCRSLFEFLHG